MADTKQSVFRILVICSDQYNIFSTITELFSGIPEQFDEQSYTLNFTQDNRDFIVRATWPESDLKISKSFDAIIIIIQDGSSVIPVGDFSRQFLPNSVHKVLVANDVETSGLAADIGAAIVRPRDLDQVFPLLLRLDRELDEAIQRVFVSFDRDSSGFIDINELRQVGDELGISLSEEDIQNVLVDVDSNLDNKISLEEFRKWWKSGRKGKAVLFRKMTGLQAKFLGLIDNANLELLQQLEDVDQKQTNNVVVTFNLGDTEQAKWRNTMRVHFKTGRDEVVESILSQFNIQKTDSTIVFGISIMLQENVDKHQVLDRANSAIRRITNLLSSASRSFAEFLSFTDFKVRVKDGGLAIFMVLDLPQSDLRQFDSHVWNRFFRFFLSEEHPQLLKFKIRSDSDLSALIQEDSINLNGLYRSTQLKITTKIWHGLLNWALEAGSAYINRDGAPLLLLGLLEQGNFTFNFKSNQDIPEELKTLVEQAPIPPISALKEMLTPKVQEILRELPFVKEILLNMMNDLDFSEVVEVGTFRTLNLIARSKSRDVNFLFKTLLDIAGVE